MWGQLDGRVSLALTIREDGGDQPLLGTGRIEIRDLRLGSATWIESIRGEMRITDREVRLSDVTATIGEGLLRGQLAWNRREWERSWFNFALYRVEARDLLLPWRETASIVEGPLEVHLRGNLGREWRGTGQMLLQRGRVFGVEVHDWRLPIDFAFLPLRNRGRIEVRESAGQAAGGRVLGNAAWSWGGNSQLDGQIRFFGVQAQALLRQLADVQTNGSGQISGRIDFGGDNVRSIEDVSADVYASMQQGQALGFPVLAQIAPFLYPAVSAGTIFQSGELRARLATGAFSPSHLSRLELATN
jgi:hypothetical protein